MPERLKPERWTAQVVPRAAQQIGEQAALPVEVKELRLGTGILHPLCPEEVGKRTLAAAGGAEDEKMPHVADMIDHTEERGLLRLRIKPRQSVQVAIPLWPRPGRREPRAEMCQCQ